MKTYSFLGIKFSESVFVSELKESTDTCTHAEQQTFQLLSERGDKTVLATFILLRWFLNIMKDCENSH